MKNIFTIFLVALFAFVANAEVCTVTLTGDWTNSTLRIKEPAGVDTIINATSQVWFRGTGNAVFIYSGVNNTNTFEYLNCAGYDFTSPLLTDGDVYISAGALPVELTYFKAELVSNTVVLKWQTATEENNAGFEVERSTDGSQFETLGFVEGNGTTTEVKNYTYIDYEIQKGIVYYRLKQIDLDGAFEYSNIVYVNFKGETGSRIFGSNLVESQLSITGSGTALVINSGGKVVETLQLTESNIVTIDISDYAKGIYYVKLENETLCFVKL